MKTQLNFKVDHQKLSQVDNFYLVASQAEQYVRAKFSFSDEWEPENTTVVFTSPDGTMLTSELDDSNECYVPNEVLTKPGYLITSLFCSKLGESVDDYGVTHDYTALRITTNTVKSYIHKSL